MLDYDNDLRGVILDAEWELERKDYEKRYGKKPLKPVRYDIITGWIWITRHYEHHCHSEPVIELKQALGRFGLNLDMRRII